MAVIVTSYVHHDLLRAAAVLCVQYRQLTGCEHLTVLMLPCCNAPSPQHSSAQHSRAPQSTGVRHIAAGCLLSSVHNQPTPCKGQSISKCVTANLCETHPTPRSCCSTHPHCLPPAAKSPAQQQVGVSRARQPPSTSLTAPPLQEATCKGHQAGPTPGHKQGYCCFVVNVCQVLSPAQLAVLLLLLTPCTALLSRS